MKPNKKKQMSLKEKIQLNPLKKYKKYDRFPLKLILQILLVIFTTAQVLSLTKLRVGYQREMYQVLRDLVYPEDVDENDSNFKIFSTYEFQSHFRRIQEVFGNLDGETVIYVYSREIEYNFNVYYDLLEEDQLGQWVFPIEDIYNFKEPFDLSDNKSVNSFLRKSSQIQFEINNFKTYVPYESSSNYEELQDRSTCFQWNVLFEYTVVAGVITGEMYVNNLYCNDHNIRDFGYSELTIHLLVLFFACCSFYLSMKYVHDILAQYKRHINKKKKIQDNINPFRSMIHQNTENQNKKDSIFGLEQNIGDLPKEEEEEQIISSSDSEKELEELLDYSDRGWQEITFTQKIKFFNISTFLSIIGNLLQIFGTIICLLNIFTNIKSQSLEHKVPILGFGSVFAWVVLLNLFSHSETFNLMNMVLFRASNSVFYFIIGCLPLFMGFSFLCQVVFISVSKFVGIKLSSLSLFSMMLGDSVRDFFTETMRQGVLGHIILMIYMLCFFTAVQNIFIAIVMESYDQVQITKKKKAQRKIDQKQSEEVFYLQNKEIEEDTSLRRQNLKSNNKFKKYISDNQDQTLQNLKAIMEKNQTFINKKITQLEKVLEETNQSNILSHKEKDKIYTQTQHKLQKLQSILFYEINK